MKNIQNHTNRLWKPVFGTLALALGTMALIHPAQAQDDDAFGAQRRGRNAESQPIPPLQPTVYDEQAKAILAKSVERYRNLQSWHVEELVLSTGRYARTISADFRAPQNLVVTTKEAKGIKLVAYYNADGVSTVRDFDQNLEYRVSPPSSDGDAQKNVRLSFGSAVGPYLSGFLSGEENVFGRQSVQTIKYAGPATVNGVAVENITVTSLRRGVAATTVYSIGKADSLLYKVVQDTTNADGTPAQYVETYSNQKIDPALPESEFQFAPPEGAVKVDRFTPSRGIQVHPGDTPFAVSTKDLAGQDISLDQYKGKVVLLDFWATWCAPCRAELPNVKAAYAKYKDQGFDVLGVSMDETTGPLPKFIAKEALPWRQVFDGYWNGPVAKAFNVRFIPATVLIGRDGKVAAVGASGADLEPAIQAALQRQ